MDERAGQSPLRARAAELRLQRLDVRSWDTCSLDTEDQPRPAAVRSSRARSLHGVAQAPAQGQQGTRAEAGGREQAARVRGWVAAALTAPRATPRLLAPTAPGSGAVCTAPTTLPAGPLPPSSSGEPASCLKSQSHGTRHQPRAERLRTAASARPARGGHTSMLRPAPATRAARRASLTAHTQLRRVEAHYAESTSGGRFSTGTPSF